MQNFSTIMKQAKKMQERLVKIQEELAEKTVGTVERCNALKLAAGKGA